MTPEMHMLSFITIYSSTYTNNWTQQFIQYMLFGQTHKRLRKQKKKKKTNSNNNTRCYKLGCHVIIHHAFFGAWAASGSPNLRPPGLECSSRQSWHRSSRSSSRRKASTTDTAPGRTGWSHALDNDQSVANQQTHDQPGEASYYPFTKLQWWIE